MEPVADEIGHCFVVGARHQLRASMSAGWRGSAGQVRRNFRQLSPHRTTGFFFSQLSPTGPLELFFHSCRLRQPRHFFPGNPLARARQSSDAGQARPGFYAGQLGPRSHWQKKRAAVLPPREDWNFFLGRIPTLARAWQAGGSDAGQECGALGIEASDAGQECDARKHKWHLCF